MHFRLLLLKSTFWDEQVHPQPYPIYIHFLTFYVSLYVFISVYVFISDATVLFRKAVSFGCLFRVETLYAINRIFICFEGSKEMKEL